MSSVFFADVNSDNVCVSVLSYEQALDNPPDNYISIELSDAVVVGSTWDGSSWTNPEEEEAPSKAVGNKAWRDEELMKTDHVATITDFPNRDNILVYRQALRDWPSTSDFPDTKPTL